VTLRHTIRHATGNPGGALPGAAVHAKDPDTPGATRAPMLLQHPDQYRWPDYTYLVATRIDLSRTRVLRPGKPLHSV